MIKLSSPWKKALHQFMTFHKVLPEEQWQTLRLSTTMGVEIIFLFYLHNFHKDTLWMNRVNVLTRWTQHELDCGCKQPLHQNLPKKVREKSRECHNHKPQPFSDTKRKRKQTKPNKRKSNKSTKSTKISSLFPKRGNRNAKWLKNTRTK